MSLSKHKKLPKTAVVDKVDSSQTQNRSRRAVKYDQSLPVEFKPNYTYEGVEELRYEENEPSPNYRIWLDQLTLAVEQKWPDLSRIFTTKGFVYWTPPEVQLPTAEEELADAATGGYRRYMTKFLLTARQARIDKMEIDKIPCFAFIMSTVSEESRSRIRETLRYS